jgi:protein-tyrosine phosphatase
VIDLHFHLLPGVDDGPRDLGDAVSLARAAAEVGVDTIVATPHVSWEWNNTPRTIAEGVRRLDAELTGLAIPVRVLAGAEVALTRAIDLADADLHRLTLGGGPWLLIEAPHSAAAVGVDGMLMRLQHRGHRIVLAHVERCPAFMNDPNMLERLVREGMLASVTAGSLVGRFGAPVQRFARRLLASGLIHNVASDAHDCQRRPPGLMREVAGAGFSEHTTWLTMEVPAAILAGHDVPPPPSWTASAARPRLLSRLRR